MTDAITFASLAEKLDQEQNIQLHTDRLTTAEKAVWRRLMSRAIKARGLRFRSSAAHRMIVFWLPDRSVPDSPGMRAVVEATSAVFARVLSGEPEEPQAKSDRLAEVERGRLYATIPSNDPDAPAATYGPLADAERARETVLPKEDEDHAFIDPTDDNRIVIVNPGSKFLPRWTVPNFAKIYSADSLMGMTPRTALALWMTAGPMSDYARDDLEEIRDKPVNHQNEGSYGIFTQLPPMSWGHVGIFRERIIRCFDDLEEDIEKGVRLEPRNTAEEIVLHLIIRQASQVYMDQISEGYMSHVIDLLPAHEDDYDFRGLYDEFFQDADYELLWEADGEMLGIDHPEHPINEAMGIGDKRVEAWFQPFGNVPHRDPGRGFNRPRS